MQQEKEKHLHFFINKTTRSHETGARVEVCAHLAIAKKNMVLNHFDPIKDSNMVYKDITKLNLGVGSRQRCQVPEQQNSSKLDIKVTKITPLLIVFLEQHQPYKNPNSKSNHPDSRPVKLLIIPISTSQVLFLSQSPIKFLSFSLTSHKTLTVSFAESQVSTLPRSFFSCIIFGDHLA